MTAQTLGFGVFYFGLLEEPGPFIYDRFLDSVKMADRLGLDFVSVPERHFHRFGGAFPSPAVLGSAIAAVTTRIQIRAGSVVGPLWDALRIAEDWAVLHQISHNRAAISLGSGWSVNDFALAPNPVDRYRRRRQIVVDQVAELQRLWRGERVLRLNAVGEQIEVGTYPLPGDSSIPLWLTAGGSEDTFRAAGRLGLNVLTHLERQDLPTLARRIDVYRAARATAGHAPETGTVTLMQHTLIARDEADITELGRAHLERYIRASLDLEAATIAGGGHSSGGAPVLPINSMKSDDVDLLRSATQRYLTRSSLIGGIADCRERALGYREAGVDEIACLVDFVNDDALMTETIRAIATLREGFGENSLTADTSAMVNAFNAVLDDRTDTVLDHRTDIQTGEH